MQGLETVGRYLIEQEIGRGGMGIVYKAHDPDLNRPIALKLLAPHLNTDPDATSRFHREAASIANLDHPNIASVYEVGNENGHSFIALQWIDGKNLKLKIAEDGAYTIETARPIIQQLVSALDYAHIQGVIHRDLKPSNILVQPNGQVSIVDFGVAWVESAPTITMTGSIIGTPRYMSPEQIAGKPLDGRADQYSLAAIVYEMLTGAPPFTTPDTAALLHQQLFAPPEPVTERNPQIPAYVGQAVERSLQKDPTERFPTTSDFYASLLGVDNDTLFKGRAIPDPDQAVNWPRLARLLTIPVLLGVLAWAGYVSRGQGQSGSNGVAPYAFPTWQNPRTSEYGGRWQNRLLYNEILPFESEPRWNVPLERVEHESLLSYGDHLWVISGQTIRNIRTSDGGFHWSDPIDVGSNIVAHPALFVVENSNDEVLVIPTESGDILGLGALKGSFKWRIDEETVGGIVADGMTPAPFELDSDVDWDGVIFITENGLLYWLDPLTGELELIEDLSDAQPFRLSPTVTDIGVYVPNQDQLFAFDVNGNPAWTAEIDGTPITPAVTNETLDVVAIGTHDTVQAFSILSGEEVWRAEVEDLSGLSADWARIFATDLNGTLTGWYDSGEEAWSVEIPENSFPAIPSPENILIVSQDGRIVDLDSETGELNYEQSFSARFSPDLPPMVSGHWLYGRTDTQIGAIAPIEP